MGESEAKSSSQEAKRPQRTHVAKMAGLYGEEQLGGQSSPVPGLETSG